MSSPRLKANRLGLWFQLPGDDEDEWRPVWTDVSAAKLINDPELDYTYDMHAYPARDMWVLEISAIQSTHPQSLCMLLWDHPYEIVPFRFAPHNNTDPDEEHPHFVGKVQLIGRPDLGGEAARYGSQAFNFLLNVTEGPDKVPA